MIRHVLELFAKGIAGTNDTHMFRVAGVQDGIDPGGLPAIAVTMRDERRGHVLISVSHQECIVR